MSDDSREGRAMGETVAGSIFCHAVVQGRDITVRLSPRPPPRRCQSSWPGPCSERPRQARRTADSRTLLPVSTASASTSRRRCLSVLGPSWVGSASAPSATTAWPPSMHSWCAAWRARCSDEHTVPSGQQVRRRAQQRPALVGAHRPDEHSRSVPNGEPQEPLLEAVFPLTDRRTITRPRMRDELLALAVGQPQSASAVHVSEPESLVQSASRIAFGHCQAQVLCQTVQMRCGHCVLHEK